MEYMNNATMLALFGRIGGWEILIILVAILLLFGGKRLPELARGLAKGIKSFKKEMKGVSDEMKDAMSTDEDSPDSSSDDSQEDESRKS